MGMGYKHFTDTYSQKEREQLQSNFVYALLQPGGPMEKMYKSLPLPPQVAHAQKIATLSPMLLRVYNWIIKKSRHDEREQEKTTKT